MTWSCAELFTQEMAAACLQAEASAIAGKAQATAALWAGGMTLAAGLIALVAALGAAYIGSRSVTAQIAANALSIQEQIKAAARTAKDQIDATNRGVQYQIAAAKQLQAEAQKKTTKTDVYLEVVTGLYGGMLVIARMANSNFALEDVLNSYQTETSKTARIHMVAPLDVMEDVLKAIEIISKTYLDLMVERERLKKIGQLDQDQWGFICLDKVRSLISPITQAAISMRKDIDIPIDHQLYEKLIHDMVQRTDTSSKAALVKLKRIFSK